ncbi:hypothetical protein G6L37_00390 [Agrobacterium rubi]|nr:hypothetical protein [Agrobacterium rubi]NTF23847.1 hypothetical protein [Agrobacterium rubi]
MATRSHIHVQREDGKWASVYCHNDGYYENNGRLIHQFYNTQERAEALVALGSISSIGESIGVRHDFDYYFTFSDKHNRDRQAMQQDPEFARLQRMCKFYGRDRGEEDVEPLIGDSLEEVFQEEEFTYVWRNGEWFAMTDESDLDELRPLKIILVENGIETEASADEIASALALEVADAAPSKPVWAA